MTTNDRDKTAPEDCRRVADALVAECAKDAWALLDGLRGHIARCPACHERFVRLGQSVMSGEEQITCGECQAQWPDLVATEEREQAPERLQRALEHLARCSRCAREYGRLEQALSLEAVGQLEEPGHYPHFDLAFLSPPEVWALAPQQTPGRQIRQLAEGVTLRAGILKRKVRASFEDLPPWLSPFLVPAYTAAPGPSRRARRGARGQLLSLPDCEMNVRVTLTVLATRQGKGHLDVQVCELESGRPLEWLQISLRGSAGRESLPAREGRASFSGLDADQYLLVIRTTQPGGAGPEWRLAIAVETG